MFMPVRGPIGIFVKAAGFLWTYIILPMPGIWGIGSGIPDSECGDLRFAQTRLPGVTEIA
jgi:hypothetical protein